MISGVSQKEAPCSLRYLVESGEHGGGVLRVLQALSNALAHARHRHLLTPQTPRSIQHAKRKQRTKKGKGCVRASQCDRRRTPRGRWGPRGPGQQQAWAPPSWAQPLHKRKPATTREMVSQGDRTHQSRSSDTLGSLSGLGRFGGFGGLGLRGLLSGRGGVATGGTDIDVDHRVAHLHGLALLGVLLHNVSHSSSSSPSHESVLSRYACVRLGGDGGYLGQDTVDGRAELVGDLVGLHRGNQVVHLHRIAHRCVWFSTKRSFREQSGRQAQKTGGLGSGTRTLLPLLDGTVGDRVRDGGQLEGLRGCRTSPKKQPTNRSHG